VIGKAWGSTSFAFRPTKYKVTGKVHEGPEGEERYTSTLSLTSALDGVDGQRHAPAALLPGTNRYSSYRSLGVS